MNRNLSPAQASAQDAERRQPVAGESSTRAAAFLGASYSAESRTVQAVLSAGTLVRRWGYDEELEISADAIDLARVNSGLCRLLNAHNQWEIDAVLGTVSAVRIEDGELVGTLTFGETDSARQAEGMVSRGELTGISIGYQPREWTLVRQDEETGRDTWRATRWELLEVSLVPVPADANAGVRSQPASPSPASGATATLNEETDMNRSNPGGAAAPAPVTAATPAAAPAAPAADVRAADPAAPVAAPVAAPAAGSEVSRFQPLDAVAFIDDARSLGVETRARELVAQNAAGTVSVEAARSALLSASAEAQRAATSGTRAGPSASVTTDSLDATRAIVVDALASRVLRTAPTQAGANEYMGVRLLELAAQRAGVNARDARDYVTVMRAAMTTSDFPIILENVANRVLLARYEAAPTVYRQIARQRDLTDFKPTKLLRIGDFPMLQKYGEDGEIKYGSINEGSESVVMGSYGRNLRLSRQAIINDDLMAFDDVMGSIGDMVSRFENDTFFTMKAANSGNGPKLADNVNLFNSAHGNLAGSGAALSVATVSAGRAAMRKQKGLDGQLLNVAPEILLVGPDQETAAEAFLTPIAPVVQGEANPFSSRRTLSIEVDATIAGNAWELYANPQRLPVFHFGFLAGESGPRVLTEEGFDYDGVGWSVRLDFYAGATDYRGGYRNPGQ